VETSICAGFLPQQKLIPAGMQLLPRGSRLMERKKILQQYETAIFNTRSGLLKTYLHEGEFNLIFPQMKAFPPFRMKICRLPAAAPRLFKEDPGSTI